MAFNNVMARVANTADTVATRGWVLAKLTESMQRRLLPIRRKVPVLELVWSIILSLEVLALSYYLLSLLTVDMCTAASQLPADTTAMLLIQQAGESLIFVKCSIRNFY